MKGLFIRGIDAELRQSLIDCGFEPVKQDVYFNGTMVTSDGRLWHPSKPFKPWNPDGTGWPECKVFNNASDFLTAAKEMLKKGDRHRYVNYPDNDFGDREMDEMFGVAECNVE